MFSLQRHIVLLAALAILVSGASAQTIIHVPDDHESIQEAIDAATNGDEIIVAPGTYNEAINFLGKAVHLRSSDGPADTISDGTGLEASVVTCTSGEGSDTILEGFTITGGTGTFVNNLRRGGGMYNVGSRPTVTNCDFVGNTANRGGGMYNQGSSPEVTNCVFENNEAGLGGGMYNGSSSSPEVTDCVFENNETSSGGGMNNSNSSPTVYQLRFREQFGGELGRRDAKLFSE